MPDLSEIRKMDFEELEELAAELGLCRKGEAWQECAKRLYLAGKEAEAFVVQTMIFRAMELTQEVLSRPKVRRHP